jgi:hypothetical protein
MSLPARLLERNIRRDTEFSGLNKKKTGKAMLRRKRGDQLAMKLSPRADHRDQAAI